ncbi:hypothetical protein Taro_048879 [Colocasia esculenta]|uniref:Uncharacterized protein n=1 Tax=Colocasia esculenta TaxID=4460 RepID=A0A843X9A7_COLES|nr:hypothetical protein [Colocasia esculenta]
MRSSQAWSLLRLQRLLGDPPALTSWNNYTDPCYSDAPSPTVGLLTRLLLHHPHALPDLRILSLSSLGLWGALLGPKLARLRSLEIIDLSSNFL